MVGCRSSGPRPQNSHTKTFQKTQNTMEQQRESDDVKERSVNGQWKFVAENSEFGKIAVKDSLPRACPCKIDFARTLCGPNNGSARSIWNWVRRRDGLCLRNGWWYNGRYTTVTVATQFSGCFSAATIGDRFFVRQLLFFFFFCFLSTSFEVHLSRQYTSMTYTWW